MRVPPIQVESLGLQSVRKSSPVGEVVNHFFMDLPAPSNLSAWWNFGSLLGLCLLIQMITGLFLAMHYCCDIGLSFSSVVHMSRDIQYGFVLSNLHANGASLFFLCVYCHIGRGLYYGSYTKSMVWKVGVILFLLMILGAFIGYVLPWGQMSYWAATVMTNLLSAIPYLGGDLVSWVWGGFSVSNSTLNSFYSLHYFLPFVLGAVSGLHLLALHMDGSNNPIGSRSESDMTSFHSYYVWKDLTGGGVLGLLFVIIVLLFPYSLGDVVNFMPSNPLVTPTHIKPEWYFLFVYAILRSIPNKLGGVVALMCSMLILWVLPSLHFNKLKSLSFRPSSKVLFWFMVGDFLLLVWVGGKPVEVPYILIGQMASSFYFLYFLMTNPFLTYMENSFMKYTLDS